MAKKGILVTGGSGLVGAYAVALLLERGERPVVFDVALNERLLSAVGVDTGKVTLIRGDMMDLPAIISVIREQDCDRIIHLLDLGRDAPCLLAQPPRRLLPIDRACLCIGLRSQCGAAGRREDAAATRLTEQLPGCLVARPLTFEQPNGDVDADAGEIRRAFSQPCREIDHFDRRGNRRDFDLERDPSCATSIYACYEHRVFARTSEIVASSPKRSAEASLGIAAGGTSPHARIFPEHPRTPECIRRPHVCDSSVVSLTSIGQSFRSRYALKSRTELTRRILRPRM